MNRFKFAGTPFAIAYCGAYAVAFAQDWPLFTYYPLTGEWFWGAAKIAGKGPAMAWYGLMGFAVLVATVAALLIPLRLAERLTVNALWVFPVGCMLVSVYLLRNLLF
jgi:hypothetical protein